MQLVQASHAAFEAGQKAGPAGTETPYIAVCQTATEATLLEEATMLEKHGIPHVVFTEEDLGGQATAICTLPLSETQRQQLSHWKTWKES
jgi:hypothetical protein